MKEKDHILPLPFLFGHYLYDKRVGIFFYLLIIFIFLIVIHLNRLDYFWEVFYSVIISSFLLVLYGIYEFYCYVKSYRKLYFVLQNPEDIYGRLPQVKGLQSELYSEIIWRLDERRRRIISKQCEQEKERKDYYSMWVHQIKTPIQAARLLLEREELKGLGAAKGIEEEIFKTEQYVEMVLYYLRCQSMAEDLLLREYSLSAIVKQAVKKYATLFIYSGLSVHLEEIESLVVTDEKWLGFALEQIISNAIKYTKQGGITIYLDKSCSMYQDKKVSVCLVIEDSGISIRDEDLPRIFEKGFTGFNGRLDKKSTGIGLYLCKEILKKLAVSISVTSQIGVGTKVYLYFQEKGEGIYE